MRGDRSITAAAVRSSGLKRNSEVATGSDPCEQKNAATIFVATVSLESFSKQQPSVRMAARKDTHCSAINNGLRDVQSLAGCETTADV